VRLPQGVDVHPEEVYKLFHPLLMLSSVEGLLPFSPIVWYVSFGDLKQADLDDYFNAIRIVRVAGEKQPLDTLHDAAYAGSSLGLCEVSVEVNQKTMTPRFLDLAAVQMGNCPKFVALRAEFSHFSECSRSTMDS
jgi:hypothetical protein